MNTGEEEKFLYIDGVEKLMGRYCKILESEQEKKNHAVVIYGDTGCGKKFFCNECMRMAKVQNRDAEDVVIVDMIGEFEGSNFDSEEKLRRILGIIEYEISKKKGYEELRGKEENSEVFKRVLKQWLFETNNVLLIRFPKIEVLEEIEEYFNKLFVNNTILYFVMEKGALVRKCMKSLGRNIQYFECKPLKRGDGELVIKSSYSGAESPVFDLDAIEAFMEDRWIDDRDITIKEFKAICDTACRYAKERNINLIKEKDIGKALMWDFKCV